MTRLCDLRPGDVSRLEERKGWLGRQPGLDPQTDHGDAWRDDDWADDVLRRHESSENERRAA